MEHGHVKACKSFELPAGKSDYFVLASGSASDKWDWKNGDILADHSSLLVFPIGVS